MDSPFLRSFKTLEGIETPAPKTLRYCALSRVLVLFHLLFPLPRTPSPSSSQEAAPQPHLWGPLLNGASQADHRQADLEPPVYTWSRQRAQSPLCQHTNVRRADESASKALTP